MIILSLGCNVGDRLANLRDALARLKAIDEITICRVSPVYMSDALLLPDSPEIWDQPFLNLSLGISTDLSPEELLIKTKHIEKAMGRESNYKWSPRVIDIDILVWHEESFQIGGLNIPHKDILERPFELFPLSDIYPDWKCCIPGCKESGKFARELVKKYGSRFDGNASLNTKQIAHRIDTPIMMGILNFTPDSFSDGGEFFDYDRALEQVKFLFESGADVIDIGAESTRPGSKSISFREEWGRLKPLLDAWPSFWDGYVFKPKLSVDTYKPETADKLLHYNIDYFNDVGGLLNPRMQEIVGSSEAKIVFMHSLCVPVNPKIVLSPESDVVSVVYEWGETQLNNLIKMGIDKKRLIFDVGIGFGKDAGQSLALIKNIGKFRDLGIPLLVGHSRKSFLSQITSKKFAERDLETAVFSGFLADKGVDYLRVHNVDENMRLLKINAAL